ncbi:YoaK family protein [Arenimonas sp.]|uniref:YoaK family protein n=1 Tax=Arenimonas sp. TaxID=1872635 RepID=UPI0039E68908
MAERLPAWVWLGAAVLSCVAGMVNVVGYLGFEHQAVSHLTGTTSLIGAAVADGDGRLAGQLFAVLMAFVLGAVASGLVIQDSTLKLGRRYGLVLVVEAIALVAAARAFQAHSLWGGWLAAFACGLQNAMVTTYSGSVVRTSHLSGMFTDLGIFLGHRLRGLPVPRRRLLLCLTITCAFFAGGVLGAILFGRVGYDALYLPAGVTGLTGAVYAAYRQLTARGQAIGR